MLNSERQNLPSTNNSIITYYSKLGYIEVDKNEILDLDKELVNYISKDKTKSGVINVKIKWIKKNIKLIYIINHFW